MTDPRRAVIFGRQADVYDSARPSYPREAIDHVMGLTDVARALEIGAGTGKATVDMSGNGFEIVAVEPSPPMAEILANRELEGVSVHITTFEEWVGPADSFDLVYAAQAWHWVDHGVGYRKVLDLLRQGGFFVVMWNIPDDRYKAFQQVYERHAPELLEERDRRIQMRDSVTWGDAMEEAGFLNVQRSTFRWVDTLSPDQVRALYSSYSDHMMVPEKRRGRLLDALAGAVEEMGGSIDVSYRTEVFSGRKS